MPISSRPENFGKSAINENGASITLQGAWISLLRSAGSGNGVTWSGRAGGIYEHVKIPPDLKRAWVEREHRKLSWLTAYVERTRSAAWWTQREYSGNEILNPRSAVSPQEFIVCIYQSQQHGGEEAFIVVVWNLALFLRQCVLHTGHQWQRVGSTSFQILGYFLAIGLV